MQNVKFYPFPTKLKAPKQRKIWIDLLRRKCSEPKEHHRVCSRHFVDGCPTEKNPYPTLFAYNNYQIPAQPRLSRAIDKRERRDIGESSCSDLEADEPVIKQIPLVDIHTDEASGIYQPVDEITVETTPICGIKTTREIHVPSFGYDHTYYHRDADVASCTREIGTQTDTTLSDMDRYYQHEQLLADKKKLLRELFVEKITESDSNVKAYLGIPSVVTLLGIFFEMNQQWSTVMHHAFYKQYYNFRRNVVQRHDIEREENRSSSRELKSGLTTMNERKTT